MAGTRWQGQRTRYRATDEGRFGDSFDMSQRKRERWRQPERDRGSREPAGEGRRALMCCVRRREGGRRTEKRDGEKVREAEARER